MDLTKKDAMLFAREFAKKTTRIIQSADRRGKFRCRFTLRFYRQEPNGVFSFTAFERGHAKGRVLIGVVRGKPGVVDQYHFNGDRKIGIKAKPLRNQHGKFVVVNRLAIAYRQRKDTHSKD